VEKRGGGLNSREEIHAELFAETDVSAIEIE
jgi:hypothetical protein